MPKTTPNRPRGSVAKTKTTIHPLAHVAAGATIGEGVDVGPFCVVGPDVTIGSGTRLVSSVTLMGKLTLGENNIVYPGAILGAPPQDKKWSGAQTCVEIGNGNVIREQVTIHAGTEKGGGITRVGDNNYLMVGVHLGHDVCLGNNCILTNNVLLAGHVLCGDNVNIAGAAAANHFVTIGEFAFIGGMSRLKHDVPPFCRVDDDKVRGVNEVGMLRGGVPEADVECVRQAVWKIFYGDQAVSRALSDLEAEKSLNPLVKRLVQFLRRRELGSKGRYLETKRK